MLSLRICLLESKNSIDWDKQPLGQVPDTKLARELGVTRQRIEQIRKARGIPSFRATLGPSASIDWSTQPLGQIPDHQIAKNLGVNVRLVQSQRKRMNIAPAPTSTRQKRVSKLDANDPDLGKKSDADVAKNIV